jgi:probable phosphoglycerate mutase
MSETSYRQRRFQPPPGATEILLVRHGESAPEVPGQPAPQVDGHGDPALAPGGQRQAELVGARLAGQPIAAIYVSTLQRTHQTAAPLARHLGLTPIVEPDLREVHLGEWEGTFRQRVAEGGPVVAKLFQEGRWDVIPGAETAEAFAARTTTAIDRIAAAHPGRLVAVVCHGGVIGQVVATASRGGNAFAFSGADNASISRLVVAGGRWIIRGFNDTAHLPEVDADR